MRSTSAVSSSSGSGARQTVLAHVAKVGAENGLLYGARGLGIVTFNPDRNSFGHTSHEIILAQVFHECVVVDGQFVPA